MDGFSCNGEVSGIVHQHREQKTVGKEMKKLAKPLLDVHCITDPECEYPSAVKIAMDDGTVQTYFLDCPINPNVRKAQTRFDESIQISIGYQYKPKKRRNRIHRCDR